MAYFFPAALLPPKGLPMMRTAHRRQRARESP